MTTFLLAQISSVDIHDIRGPVPVPTIWDGLWWVLCILWGIGLLIVIVFWWRQRHRPVVPPPDPYALAMTGLDHARALLEPSSAREFSIAVSDVVRTYIERRFQARAAHRTTEEFLHDLLSTGELGSHRARLAEFLQHCDLAKFGRWPLSLEQMETMFESARLFLTESRPIEEAEGGK